MMNKRGFESFKQFAGSDETKKTMMDLAITLYGGNAITNDRCDFMMMTVEKFYECLEAHMITGYLQAINDGQQIQLENIRT